MLNSVRGSAERVWVSRGGGPGPERCQVKRKRAPRGSWGGPGSAVPGGRSRASWAVGRFCRHRHGLGKCPGKGVDGSTMQGRLEPRASAKQGLELRTEGRAGLLRDGVKA